MGLDSSNRDIPNASTNQSGSVSPAAVSLNYLTEDTQARRGSSCRYRKDLAMSKKGPRMDEGEKTSLSDSTRSAQEGALDQEDAEDEPSNPAKGVQDKKGVEPLLPEDTSGDESSDDSEASSTLERRAPDGGWGWVVVAAAFFINMVADGVTFSFGTFFIEFMKYFDKSKSATAWIGSLLAAMPLLSGPIASSLTDRYGCRKVTIAGGFVSSLGFILSSFANSIEMLYVTFGMITGFGLSLCYVAAVVSVAYYFEQRRSLATGISVCGGGIGTFIFAPLTQLLINEFGWQNATRILALPFLFLCCCGLVMRDLEWTKKSRPSRKKMNNSPSLDSSTNGEITASYPKRLYSSAICIPTFLQDQERSARIASRTRNQTITCAESQRRTFPHVQAIPFQTSNNSPVNASRPCSDSPRQKGKNGVSANQDINGVPASTGHFTIREGSITGTPPKRHQSTSGNSAAAIVHTNGFRHAHFQPGVPNSTEMGLHRHSLTYRGAVVSLKRYRLRPASSCPDIISVATTEQASHEWKAVVSDVCKWARALFEWRSLSCSRRFILFVLSNFLLYMWYDVVYIYLQDSAQDPDQDPAQGRKQYTETEASMLISILGLFNMIGNLTLGYMGDKEWTDATLVYGICMIFCGLSVIMLPTFLSWGYVSLAMDCGLYGLAIAANYSLTSVILVKVVSLERFATAYGLLLLVQGIGNLVGPPIAGLISDWTGTSSWSYWVAGTGILLSSLFILIPKIFTKCSQLKEDEANEEEA